MGGCLSRKKGSSSLNATTPVVSLSSMEAVVPDKLCALKGDADVNIKEKLVGEEKVKKQLVVEEEGLVKKEIFVIKHRTSHDREKLAPPQKDIGLVEENRVASALPSSTNTNPSAGDVKIGNNDSTMVMRTSSCAKEEVDAILIQCGRLSRSNSFGAGKAPSSGRKYSGHKRSYDLDHNDQDQDVEIAPASTYNPRKSNADEDNEMAADRRQHRQRHRHSGRSSPSSSSQGRRRTPSREREQRSGSRERGSGSSSSGRRVSRSPGRRSETTPTANSNGSSNANNTTTTTNRPGKMVSVPATVSSLTMDKSKNGVESQTGTAIKRISVKRNVGDSAMSNSRGAASPRSQSPAQMQKPNADINNRPVAQGTNCRGSSNTVKEAPVIVEETEVPDLKPQTLTRSRHTEFSPKEHHDPPSFSVPLCVTKACSILEAVADLNSTTSSNLSCAFVEDRRSPTTTGANLVGKKLTEAKDPFVESEVLVSDDIMEPSFHKYVTVRRGGKSSREDMDEQESSGSNSFVGGSLQHWGEYSTSTWEPNSTDSTDSWTSRYNTRRRMRRTYQDFKSM
ncbi:hypothetical protein GH714_033540 [Hevea brasiliensis]|uniref:Uncharacterized protein n=1 Tax=Hevea brasiliensis TaxID=3981 RepID=A0A6A6MM01_HEVBR|nr:hypothetical protein GH714_033540 [Hevea brasiliensis]